MFIRNLPQLKPELYLVPTIKKGLPSPSRKISKLQLGSTLGAM